MDYYTTGLIGGLFTLGFSAVYLKHLYFPDCNHRWEVEQKSEKCKSQDLGEFWYISVKCSYCDKIKYFRTNRLDNYLDPKSRGNLLSKIPKDVSMTELTPDEKGNLKEIFHHQMILS